MKLALTLIYSSTFVSMGVIAAFVDGRTLIFTMIGFVIGAVQSACVSLKA